MRRSAGLLFLVLCAAELFLLGFLAAAHRMPNSQDTFQYFSLQYYFLNNAAQAGEIPQWIPFIANGTVATWWNSIQASPLQMAFLSIGRGFRGADLLVPFYAGIFWDLLLLMLGTWLLAKRTFQSGSTAFFVTLAVTGSAVWTSQPWFNFHFYNAVPLLLYLLHRFLESGRWRYFLLAGNLLALQALGNLPYFLPVTSMVLFLYILFYGLSRPRETWAQIRSLRWGWEAWGALLLNAAFLFAVFGMFTIGTEQTVHYNQGRNPDGTASLEVFLTYAGNQGLAKWAEMVLGVSPARDYTLYIGLLGAAFLLWGIRPCLRRHPHLLLLTGFLLAFSMGGWTARLSYYAWPMMKYFRHLGFTTGFIKLFLCFVAGVGFEDFFRKEAPSARRKTAALTLSLLLLALSGLLFYLSQHPAVMEALIRRVFSEKPWEIHAGTLNHGFLSSQLSGSAALAGIGALLLACCFFSRARRYRKILVGLALFLQFADLYSYKWADAMKTTTPLAAEQRLLTRGQPIPFPIRRVRLLEDHRTRPAAMKNVPYFGETTWAFPLFFFSDEAGCTGRIDYTEKPYDQFVRTYWGLSLSPEEHARMKKFIYYHLLLLPFRHPAAQKISGVTEDKIQFFSRAVFTPNETQAASWIRHPSYDGDSLVLLGDGSDEFQPAAGARLRLPYRVERFDSNHLAVSVTAPKGEPAWMLYSDVWHPGWRASVNGNPVPIHRANLAYKAIRLEPGLNQVHFHFRLPALEWVQRLFVLNAWMWIALTGLLLWRVARLREEGIPGRTTERS
ncbi:MAG: hypothetical protein Q7J69_05460 [Candidatus Omnitrophota bacterium]|nr:hypothetical protein [Candidatus Omnitrophota bacterium]